jgi:hypothetical protein
VTKVETIPSKLSPVYNGKKDQGALERQCCRSGRRSCARTTLGKKRVISISETEKIVKNNLRVFLVHWGDPELKFD